MPRTPAENRSAFLAATLARALPDAAPGAIARAVSAMQLAARAHKRDGEAACSYPRTEAQEARAAKRLERLAGKAWLMVYCASGVAMVGDAGDGWESLAAHGRTLTLRFGGDPRGPCGYLTICDMPGDGWSRDEGFAIYT